ncbi:MAG: CDP-glucose 4,6-dehydratase [Thermoleophilia bacterium]|nr:CDP-glucose 4,6-dehydratase [Thermoleophilia bacterium]
MSFYKGRNVLITGHTGFKGSWLSTWLLQLGARITGFSLPPGEGERCLFEIMGMEREAHSIYGDVRDPEILAEAFRKERPEMVFHLAAQSLVRRSYREPLETYATNVLGTAHVLEAARNTPSVGAVVAVTSDKCYQNREWLWGYRENDPLGGRDPYSSSKACAELVTEAYRESFFSGGSAARIGSCRSGNVIGGGDWCEDRLIPDIVRALAAEAPVVLRNPDSIRPWQHVLDPLNGYLMLGEKLLENSGDYTGAWNFGPADRDNRTVREMAEMFVAVWGRGSLEVSRDRKPLHEARLLKLDCSKSHSRLGWKPVLDVGEAIAMTVDWYRAYHEQPACAAEKTEQQIADYCARLTP